MQIKYASDVIPGTVNVYDVAGGNVNVIQTADLGAHAASFNGTPWINPGAQGGHIYIAWSANTATTAAAQIQWSPDGGTTWINIPGAVTANLPTGAGSASLNVYPGIGAIVNQAVNQMLPMNWRIAYTISGGTLTLSEVATAYVDG